MLSCFHSQGITTFNALSNSSSPIGRLLSEPYRLMFSALRVVVMEEQCLSLRALLLHIYSAGALTAPGGVCEGTWRLKKV